MIAKWYVSHGNGKTFLRDSSIFGLVHVLIFVNECSFLQVVAHPILYCSEADLQWRECLILPGWRPAQVRH